MKKFFSVLVVIVLILLGTGGINEVLKELNVDTANNDTVSKEQTIEESQLEANINQESVVTEEPQLEANKNQELVVTEESPKEQSLDKLELATFEVPETVIISVTELHTNLVKVQDYLKEIEANSENLNNIYFIPKYEEYTSAVLDTYISSKVPVMNISYWYHTTDTQVTFELYEYMNLYQETMQYFFKSVYDYTFNTEQYYGGLRKLDYFLELHENLSSKLKSNGSTFDFTTEKIENVEEIHPILALDALWVSYLKIREMAGNRFDSNHTFSKLPYDDVIEEINSVYSNNYKPYKTRLIKFNEETRNNPYISQSPITYTINFWEDAIESLNATLKFLDNEKQKSKDDFHRSWSKNPAYNKFFNNYIESKKFLLEQEKALN